MAGLDLSALQGIDVHVHVESDGHGQLSLDDELLAASAKYFKADNDRAPTVEQIADYYRPRQLAAVVFTVDAATATGHPALSSEEMADRASAHPDVLIPFGSVDPLAGGRGIKLRLSNPMLLDDVAADFPGMTVILAHPSVPWADSSISMATHKSNVFIDLSGWSPKYFPPALVRAANSYLQDKVLFGTDFPLLTPERCLRDFGTLDMKPEVRQKVLKDNAVRLLGLGETCRLTQF